MGADDYMEKPFDSKELVARVKAVLRRYKEPEVKVEEPASKNIQTIEYPDLKVSLIDYSVIYKGENVNMPPKELELLYFLACSPNQVFTREQLLDRIWGYDYPGDTRTVDVHIKRIREKNKTANVIKRTTERTRIIICLLSSFVRRILLLRTCIS